MNQSKKFNSEKRLVMVFENFDLYLSPEAIENLKQLQLGFDPNDPKENFGVEEHLKSLNNIQDVVSKEVENFGNQENISNVLYEIHYLKKFFRAFALPRNYKMEKEKLEANAYLKKN